MSIQVISHNSEADKAVNEAKPATETKPAPVEETPQAEKETASGAVETEEVETEGEVQPEAKTEKTDANEQAEPNPKKKGGFQKRIDKLNARIADTQREAEYWRAEALKQASAPKNEPKVESKPAAQDAAGKPKPDDFTTHAEYVEALTDWKVDQKDKARELKEAKSRVESEQQKLAREYTEREKSFAEKTADFQDVLEDAKSYGVPLSAAVRSVLVSSEKGPELLYAMAKDKALFAKVNGLAPLDAAREIGKLESGLVKPASETKEVKTTKAPNPISPVGAGGGSAAIPKTLDEAAKLSFADYKRLREEGLKKNRRRA